MNTNRVMHKHVTIGHQRYQILHAYRTEAAAYRKYLALRSAAPTRWCYLPMYGWVVLRPLDKYGLPEAGEAIS